MKSILIIAFTITVINLHGQDVVPPKPTKSPEKQYAREAAATFVDVLFRENQSYFGSFSKIGMYKNGVLMDYLDLSSAGYNPETGRIVMFNKLKPTFYRTLSSLICDPSDKEHGKGCEIRLKKLSFQIRDDFLVQRIEKVGDTLVLTTDNLEGQEQTRMKFNKKGMIENAVIYYINKVGKKLPEGNITYIYNPDGNLIHEEKNRYRSYNFTPDQLSQSITIDFAPHGERTSLVRSEYQSDNKPIVYETLFFYDSQFRLIKKKSKENKRPTENYLVEYRNDEIELFNTTESGMKEYSFVYKLIK